MLFILLTQAETHAVAPFSTFPHVQKAKYFVWSNLPSPCCVIDDVLPGPINWKSLEHSKNMYYWKGFALDAVVCGFKNALDSHLCCQKLLLSF